jgi:hypothetical protein
MILTTFPNVGVFWNVLLVVLFFTDTFSHLRGVSPAVSQAAVRKSLSSRIKICHCTTGFGD